VHSIDARSTAPIPSYYSKMPNIYCRSLFYRASSNGVRPAGSWYTSPTSYHFRTVQEA